MRLIIYKIPDKEKISPNLGKLLEKLATSKKIGVLCDTNILDNFEFKPDVITGHWLNPQLILVAGLAQYYGAKSGFVFHSDYSKNHYERFQVEKYLKYLLHVVRPKK